MHLSRGELVIRNAVPEDAEQLALWWNDGAVMAHAGFPLGLGVSAAEIANSLGRDSDETRRRLILEERGIPIGEMGFRCLSDTSVEIGIKICVPSKQNRGKGRTYLCMLIGALFSQGCKKIILDTDPNNARARHVYESLGFTCTGIQENSWTDQLGRLRSAVDYELLPQNFQDVF